MPVIDVEKMRSILHILHDIHTHAHTLIILILKLIAYKYIFNLSNHRW